MAHFEEFYACPSCGRAISGEKREYFICPKCDRALCEKSRLQNFTDKFCGHCGKNLASAKEEAMALASENN